VEPRTDIGHPDRSSAAERLAQYESMIRCENERLGLVSPHAMTNFDEHLLSPCEALARLPLFCGDGLSIVDLGSGGGLPGVPLAILHPHHTILLIDSRLRKCLFLQSVVDALDLVNVEVLHARIDKVRSRPAPQIFVSRFFKDPQLTAAWTRRWRKPGTRYLFFAGTDGPAPPAIYDLHLQTVHPLSAGKVALDYLAI
jgi:16S rRNA (guanine(527)-N(7))-methyltransferase RsmG